MDESIIVSSIIDKLPSSWKNFKKNLKHKKDDISLEQLENHLGLEEEYRKQDIEKETNVQEKTGHFKKECHFLKKKKDKDNKSSTKEDKFVAVISEIHLVNNDESWWMDSGATRHVYKNKNFFKTLEEEDRDVLYMGNASRLLYWFSTRIFEFDSTFLKRSFSYADCSLMSSSRAQLMPNNKFPYHSFSFSWRLWHPRMMLGSEFKIKCTRKSSDNSNLRPLSFVTRLDISMMYSLMFPLPLYLIETSLDNVVLVSTFSFAANRSDICFRKPLASVFFGMPPLKDPG
ncbi:Retrovirus-related Pol polyprotein from transposon TNT 1-94 [Senna tora]|uniref:Retrovirus-related Pol polyprotein from transposon TNT 1-94 n=1 Tax=Senna tora TaxID=362788 RepID=A0A834XHA5_9FABA|nr:Retrovirus-related Pol polyprotein from transposon TNT 1-94 [Senna tora]